MTNGADKFRLMCGAFTMDNQPSNLQKCATNPHKDAAAMPPAPLERRSDTVGKTARYERWNERKGYKQTVYPQRVEWHDCNSKTFG